MNPSKLAEALNVLLGQIPDVAVKPKVIEVESGKTHVRRFRVSSPSGAKALAPLRPEDGLPKPGDDYPADALKPAPEPDLIAVAVGITDDSNEAERAALIDVKYERRVPVPPPLPTDPAKIEATQHVTRKCQYCNLPADRVIVWFRGPPGSGRTNVKVPYCGTCSVKDALAARGMTAPIKEGEDYRIEFEAQQE